MFTVFRISSESHTKNFSDVQKAFEDASPGLLKSSRYTKVCISGGVYKGGDWFENRSELIRFIDKHKTIFETFYNSAEVSFTFDMAVYHEDAEGSFYCSYPLDHELLSLLCQNRIGFEFTTYYPIESGDNKEEDDDEIEDNEEEN